MQKEVTIIYYNAKIKRLEIDADLINKTDGLIAKYGGEIANDICEIRDNNWQIDRLIEHVKTQTAEYYNSNIMLNGDDLKLHLVINNRRIIN